MDHMRISGTEPSSVIFRQTVVKALKNDVQKVSKNAKAKRDGVINSQNNNFNQFLHGNFDALKTQRINQSWTYGRYPNAIHIS